MSINIEGSTSLRTDTHTHNRKRLLGKSPDTTSRTVMSHSEGIFTIEVLTPYIQSVGATGTSIHGPIF